ncbi:MAG: response regulator transcription factor [Sedimentisphaerales bacterium]|nr:response regulator transcription factor [Sedimentisphaerales bacterium]
MAIRILLADDHEIVRNGLRYIIEKHKDMEIVGEAENGRLALEQVEKLRPNVVVMDISMPELNGIEAARQIKKDYSNTLVIALSMHNKRQFVIDSIKAGVSGYVLKADVSSDLISAIKAAVSGGVFLSPRITGIIAQDYIKDTLPEIEETACVVLAPREREVLQLIAEGKATKEIAQILKLSIKTIESTRSRVMNKLDVHNIADLVKYAISEGLTSLEY